MGQCDEFASSMTRDGARRWLLYSLSLRHHVKALFLSAIFVVNATGSSFLSGPAYASNQLLIISF